MKTNYVSKIVRENFLSQSIHCNNIHIYIIYELLFINNFYLLTYKNQFIVHFAKLIILCFLL